MIWINGGQKRRGNGRREEKNSEVFEKEQKRKTGAKRTEEPNDAERE